MVDIYFTKLRDFLRLRRREQFHRQDWRSARTGRIDRGTRKSDEYPS
jgi:hypothetical protein